ncbi:MAG TPA: hypothetical protein VIK72_00385 [Clostridiaceae bacterium]
MNEEKTPRIETSSTFLVNIKYQQNTSWQGTIQWLDGKQTRHFRSCLELMLLIEEALVSDAEKNKNRKIEFHIWDGKE